MMHSPEVISLRTFIEFLRNKIWEEEDFERKLVLIQHRLNAEEDLRNLQRVI